ncbi:MAG: undecaprenyl-phosphate glucose phosphotransferase [Lachnospiraceae bacterium]|nr:undecaprenyl-phosphate glucose phosphotransferase [Lachnospiraceae bacterium]MCI9399678.1 undecaprenyl-phosphate glucose phosphotransferase [Lachnospiraceae bacterium]MCX4374740.1 undecaprenyl-phosphate glucose phosphotransferase [Lachnospiraceae bacterium]
MIRDHQKYFNRLLVLLDAVVVAASYWLAWFLWLSGSVKEMEPGTGILPTEFYFTALIAIIPGYLILYNTFDLYSSKRTAKTTYEIFNIMKANTIGLIAIMVVLFAVNIPDFSRGMVGVFYGINIVADSMMRKYVRSILRFIRKKGYNIKHILLVGYSRAAEEYINKVTSNPEWGYVVCGILDDRVPVDAVYKGVKVIGDIDSLQAILPENQLDEIGITLALADYDRLEYIVNICEKSGVHTKFIPDYNSVIPSHPYLEDFGGLAVVNIRRVPLANTANMLIKRFVDIFGAVVAIVLFSPIMLIAVIGVKTTSKGPLIFKQERVGLHNRPFQMYKFRSMEVQESEDEKKGWTRKNDPRVTKIGRILRKTSIDELPQFFNVLKGDMSLIGPRPERPLFVEKFKEEIPRYMIKHQVRPGITGWAQVNGYRGDTSIRKRIEYDLYYIENWSMALDFRILFLTFFKGFINKNAY